MEKLLSLLTAPSVWPYSILLGIILLYWITVFIGAIDLDFFDVDLDIDVDADIDVDVDVDADIDADAEAGDGLGAWGTALTFFNIGKVPFMIFLSFLILFLWVGAAVGFAMLGSIPLLFLMALIPNLIFSLFVTKMATIPFKGMHGKMTQGGTTKRDLVGKIGEVIMTVRPGRQGRIQVAGEAEVFILDVTSESEIIESGAQALIVEYQVEKDQYVVSPFSL